MNSKGTPENLRPAWRKGDPSPNPTGRPHRLPISDICAHRGRADSRIDPECHETQWREFASRSDVC
jgi:hypothetical protein